MLKFSGFSYLISGQSERVMDGFTKEWILRDAEQEVIVRGQTLGGI